MEMNNNEIYYFRRFPLLSHHNPRHARYWPGKNLFSRLELGTRKMNDVCGVVCLRIT